MKTLLSLFTYFLFAIHIDAYAQNVTNKKIKSQETSISANFDFHSINVSQVIDLIYGEVIKTPYVIHPDVLNDTRLVSFRYLSNPNDLKIFLDEFLHSLGYEIKIKNGVDFITKEKEDEKQTIELAEFVYRPKFREVSYISRLLSPLFKGSFTVNRTIATQEGAKNQKNVPEGSAASLVDQNSDTLIFIGTDKEVEKLKRLLPQIDFSLGEVVVRGVVYEVTTSEKDNSAISLLFNLLNGKLTAGVGTAANLGNFLKLKTLTLEAIYSVVQSDSRFKVVSSPSLRIKSGSQGSFSVGQDVPVLGAVSYPTGAGQAVQSVEYRSSGILFDIQPSVKDAVIDLNIHQQLSNFIPTTTGVNNSPTLTKRSLKTNVSMQDGDVIVLGGLTENKDSNSNEGLSFLPKFLHGKGKESSKSEILLILQVQKL